MVRDLSLEELYLLALPSLVPAAELVLVVLVFGVILYFNAVVLRDGTRHDGTETRARHAAGSRAGSRRVDVDVGF